MGEIKCFEIGEIGQSDGPLGGATHDPIRAVVLSFDADPLRKRSMHNEPIEFGFDGPNSPHFLGHPTDEPGQSRSGDRRDREIKFESINGHRGPP